MHFMAGRMPVSGRYGQECAAGQQVVEDRSNAADRKAENNTLDVEAAPAREVKEARRVPVVWDEERLGQAERCRDYSPTSSPCGGAEMPHTRRATGRGTRSTTPARHIGPASRQAYLIRGIIEMA